MSKLDSFNLNYEDLPKRKYKLTDRIKKMGKLKNNEQTKIYSKTRGEHTKDIIIAVLITGVITFILGVRYANNQASTTATAIQAATAAKK